MDQELKARWTAALRSGEYKQGTGALAEDGQYCCLGVLCVVAESELTEAGIELGTRSDGRVAVDGNTATLTEAASIVLGMPNDTGCLNDMPTDPNGWRLELTALNDNGMPFSQIADLIDYAL